MAYSITLSICFCWLLCGTTTKAGDSTTDDGLNHGHNNVAVDFRSRTSQMNSISPGGHSTAAPSWIWKPIGHEKNKIDSATAYTLFNFTESGSGEDDGPVNETQTSKEEIWTFNVTIEDPKTMDRKRNKNMEKAYLIYERHLRKTNWCFKDNEDGKPNYKFKKAEGCCRRHRECQAGRDIKRGIYDCSCNIYFHICLKKANTKMAKSIENMYFKRNIVCYKKQRKVCTNELCEGATYKWKIIPRHLK